MHHNWILICHVVLIHVAYQMQNTYRVRRGLFLVRPLAVVVLRHRQNAPIVDGDTTGRGGGSRGRGGRMSRGGGYIRVV